jgi:hypothetical protein
LFAAVAVLAGVDGKAVSVKREFTYLYLVLYVMKFLLRTYVVVQTVLTQIYGTVLALETDTPDGFAPTSVA